MVKSGDRVCYTTALGFPSLLGAALAKRRDDLAESVGFRQIIGAGGQLDYPIVASISSGMSAL